jgi:hypothetical protein
MSDDTFGAFPQKAAIAGKFARDYTLTLSWLPIYIEEFPQAVAGIELRWERCKFIQAASPMVPKQFGVYCFAVNLGFPFPENMNLPVYVGKASDQFLSERFLDYFAERKNPQGRKKIVPMLNKYKDRLTFWWAALPSIHVETIERHLLICCMPPCNERKYQPERFWGKAFDLHSKGEE